MMESYYGLPHIVEAQQFSRPWMEKELFPMAKEMELVVSQKGCDILAKEIMMTLFYEPSTRTRFSFEMAMLYLGGKVVHTENAGDFSSAVKGETLGDTICVACQYRPSVIVLRHHDDISAEVAVRFSSVPIINAGSGKGQHPTQALLDAWTIYKRLGHIDGLKIAMVGDLISGRTVASLSYLLGKFNGVNIYFVSPECARMRGNIKEYLDKKSVKFYETNDLRKVAPMVDVVYQTRTQKERGSTFDRNDHAIGYFNVDREVADLMKKDAIIMHPLPRVDEITPEIDGDPRAVYFEQAGNGLYIRMALLKMILSPQKKQRLFSRLRKKFS